MKTITWINPRIRVDDIYLLSDSNNIKRVLNVLEKNYKE